MEGLTPYDILFYIAVTWSIGLAPPLIIRYIIAREPISKRPALLICIIFLIFNLFLFSVLGSESKTHAVLFVIAGVSFAILRKNNSPRAGLPLMELPGNKVSLLWVRVTHLLNNIIHRQFWRIVTSFAPLVFLCPLLAYYYSIDAIESDRIGYEVSYRNYLEAKQLPRCASKPALSDKHYTKFTKEDWHALNEATFNYSDCYEPFPMLEDFNSIFQSRVHDIYPDFVLFGIFIYLALFSASLVIMERHVGWRRMTIVTSLITSPIAVLVYFYINSSYEKEVVVFSLFVVAAVAIVASLMVIIFARRIYLWVRAGFDSN